MNRKPAPFLGPGISPGETLLSCWLWPVPSTNEVVDDLLNEEERDQTAHDYTDMPH